MVSSNTATVTDSTVSRRQFLRTAGVGGTAVTVGGCLGGGSGSEGGSGDSKLSDQITFYSTGGSWARKMEKTILKPFTKKFGVKVNLQTYGDPNTMLSKIRAGQADVDAMLMTDPPLYKGVKEDIWGPLRKENIPNLDRIRTFKPTKVPYDPGGKIHHIPNTYGAYGLVYNTKKVDGEPQSWSDIYTSNLKGKLTMSQFPSAVVGTAALESGFDLNKFAEDDTKVKKVWNRVKEQNKYMQQWWDSATTAQQLYTNASAVAGNFWVGRTRVLNNDNDVPVEYTLPKEGAVGYVSVWAINSNIDDPKRYTCEKLLNYVLADKPSRRLAKHISYAQANKISNPPDSYKSIPDRKHPDQIKVWDQSVFQKHQQEWSQKFQKIVRGGG